MQLEWKKSWGGLSVVWPPYEDGLWCCPFVPQDFSSFFRSNCAHRSAELFSVSCLLHVWPQALFTAVSKYCSDLRMTVTARGVSCLEFVFNTLAASPRHGEMRRCESRLIGGSGWGRSEERRGGGYNCHVRQFLQGEGRTLHLRSLCTLVGYVSVCSSSSSILSLLIVSHARYVAPWCLGWRRAWLQRWLCWCRA